MALFSRAGMSAGVVVCLIHLVLICYGYQHHVWHNIDVDASGIRLDDSFSNSSSPDVSVCSMKCSIDPTCTSALYDREKKACHLFNFFHSYQVKPESRFVSLHNYCPGVYSRPDKCCPDLNDCVLQGPYTDCQEAFEAGDRRDGEVYYLRTSPDAPFIRAFCQFDDSAGWTVIQRRFDGSENFYRDRPDYINGFGSPHSEYWIGLDAIYNLTRTVQAFGAYMENYDGQAKTVNYSSFYIDGKDTGFKLHIDGYTGDAGNAMAVHNGMQFTTKDDDRDTYSDNCAVIRKGGWWYRSCHQTNPNGLWYPTGVGSANVGLNWKPWVDGVNSLMTIYLRISHV